MFPHRILLCLILAAALASGISAAETTHKKKASSAPQAAKPAAKGGLPRSRAGSEAKPAAKAAKPTAAPKTETGYNAYPAAARPPQAKFNNGPKSSGAVALTFDDGPHATLTPQLLETLKKLDIKATFFMLGNMVEQHPEIAKAVAEAGHEIGNHSYSHRDMTKLPETEIRHEVQRTQKLIEEATGHKPVYFRPPYGAINARVIQILKEEGLEAVNWSIDPRDWDKKVSNEKVLSIIGGESMGGSIVCIHDIHARTVNSVPAMVEAIKAKGLKLTTAGDLVTQMKEAIATGKVDSGGGAANEPAVPAAPKTIPLGKSAPPKASPAPAAQPAATAPAAPAAPGVAPAADAKAAPPAPAPATK